MTKGRPPKELLERRKGPPRKPPTPPSKSTSLDWKFWSGMALAIAALFLTVLGLWLAVEDRPTVSLGPPLDFTKLLSTQVTMVNNGVLPITNVSFGVFVKHCEISKRVAINNLVLENYEPSAHVLRPREPMTTDFSVIVGHRNAVVDMSGNTACLEFDIALIAHFRPMWAPFWNRTRTFRFRAVHTNTSTVMQQFPADNIEDEYKSALSGH
jgi:hypothetical protein